MFKDKTTTIKPKKEYVIINMVLTFIKRNKAS